MTLSSIFQQLTGTIPKNVFEIIERTASLLPDDFLPSNINLISISRFFLIYGVIILGIGIAVRLVLGHNSDLNKAISSSICIFFIYLTAVVVRAFQFGFLNRYMTPLPFVTFVDDYLFFTTFQGTSFTAICTEILNLIIISFIVNISDAILPDGDSVFSWYILRIITTAVSIIGIYYANESIRNYLPNTFVTYAPSVLLFILLATLLIGLVKLLLGVFLTFVNPVVGALYTFFFASRIGKQLSKSILTTGILCSILYVLQKYRILIIYISRDQLLTYLPTLPILLVLWYLVGRVL